METKPIHRLYTIQDGNVKQEALVERLHLTGADIDIPAIIIGEEGRGRRKGVMPVQLLPSSYKVWREKGRITITAASITQSRAGKPKLVEEESVDPDKNSFIGVFRTTIGFRGSNAHTGDRKGTCCSRYPEHCPWHSDDIIGPLPEKCPECGADFYFKPRWEFYPFPGEVLIEGTIAQGAAGRMGSGKQLIALVPANTVFRTARYGRLYGEPPAFYYIWTDEQMSVLTWDERLLLPDDHPLAI